jgi:hypothetical protein
MGGPGQRPTQFSLPMVAPWVNCHRIKHAISMHRKSCFRK